MSEFQTITLDGESWYLKPWENQRGTRYGPTDKDQYEVVLVNLDKENLDKATSHGRKPTIPEEGSSKEAGGIKKYYKLTSLYKIPIADTQTTPIPDGTFIPNGSKIRVYLEVRPIDPAYVKRNTHKFMVKGVQILEMAEMPENDDWEPSEKKAIFEALDSGYVAGAEATSDAGFEKVLPEDESPFD